MEKLDFKNAIESVDDPEILKNLLTQLFNKVENLESRLKPLSVENPMVGVQDKINRLDQIKYSLIEISERMKRPYVITAELQAVKDVLDVLAETGDCNSVILEGEPGTGKTQWAYSEVGQELQKGKDVSLIHLRVKDTMRASDLLYSIDDVRRLSDAQAKAVLPQEIRDEANAWKEKIIKGEIKTDDTEYKVFKDKMNAVTELSEVGKDLEYINYVDLGPLGEAIYQSSLGKKVYLLIDEIEKGREELMTGMLDEIENLQFTIGETGTQIKGDKRNLRIIITTNTEDSDKIPASFRRRSLYHFIEYPKRDDMAEIVKLNFPDVEQELLDYALDVFYTYNTNKEIQKKPSIPELLAWIRVLLKTQGEIPDGVPHKEILLKYLDDQNVEIGSITQGIGGRNLEVSSNKLSIPEKKAFSGEPVYKIDNSINSQYKQDDFTSFYTSLHEKGVNFYTPEFTEKQESDGYGDYETVKKLANEFQIIEPGIEYLGGGYYVISDNKLDLMKSVLSSRFERIEQDDFSIESIQSKGKEVTQATITWNNQTYNATINNAGVAIVELNFNS